VGNFPVGWAEWNGRYRDSVREYWKGTGGLVGELATRLTGSSDLYEASGRRPHASLNFVTCHDGFTLRDLVSYDHKHNEANGEDNADGESHNRSWNCGVEGPTEDPEVLALRARQQRNLLATLLLSQGVPMLLAGDEVNRTQHGNNNAYCQDNEISWMSWDWQEADRELLEFAHLLIALRRAHPTFRRRHFFQGRPVRGADLKDIHWLNADGSEMTDEQWSQHSARCLGAYLAGAGIHDRDDRGNPIEDDDFLLMINADDEEVTFQLPGDGGTEDPWTVLIDTYYVRRGRRSAEVSAGEPYPLRGRSLALLVRPRSLE
jgi:glycogen operon protein